MRNGRNAFVDYVVETSTGSYAIEENGVHYHHPQLIGLEAYKRQLEKQNTLSLMGFKTFRFSFENLRFKDQAIDSPQCAFYQGDEAVCALHASGDFSTGDARGAGARG